MLAPVNVGPFEEGRQVGLFNGCVGLSLLWSHWLAGTIADRKNCSELSASYARMAEILIAREYVRPINCVNSGDSYDFAKGVEPGRCVIP